LIDTEKIGQGLLCLPEELRGVFPLLPGRIEKGEGRGGRIGRDVEDDPRFGKGAGRGGVEPLPFRRPRRGGKGLRIGKRYRCWLMRRNRRGLLRGKRPLQDSSSPPVTKALEHPRRGERERAQEKDHSRQRECSAEKEDSGTVEQGKKDPEKGLSGTASRGVGCGKGMGDKEGEQGAGSDEKEGEPRVKGKGNGGLSKTSDSLDPQGKGKQNRGKSQKSIGQVRQAGPRHPEDVRGMGGVDPREEGGIVG
jgi:hypothetical protein